MTLFTPRPLLAALAGLLVAAVPQAQVVFDDFNDADFSNTFVFSQNNAGIGIFDAGGLLGVGVNPAEVGTFAGFGVGTPGGGSTDVSSASALTFTISAVANDGGTTQPFTLEVNLQEDANNDGAYSGADDDEFQANVQIQTDGTTRTVTLPFSSFVDDNSVNAGTNDGFAYERLFQIVFAIGGASDLGDAFSIRIGDLTFGDVTPPPPAEPGSLVIKDFEGDDPLAGSFQFSQNNGAGVNLSIVGGADGSANGLRADIDGAAAGTFAGFGFPVMSAGDAEVEALTFYIRPTFGTTTSTFTLEVNLQEDVDGNGVFDGTGNQDDEVQANYVVTASSTDYTPVSIPISEFADDNSNGNVGDGQFDYSKLLQVVFAIGGTDQVGNAFSLDFDRFAFAVRGTASEDGLPAVDALRTFPNPTTGSARVSFGLRSASDVTVEVIDLLGRRVATVAGGPQPAGPVELALPTDGLSAGVYGVRVRTSEGVSVARLTIVR